MAEQHYAYYLNKAATALSLAVSGHTAGFIAFVEAEKVDVREVETFCSMSDKYFGQTLMLVYEVVEQPNLVLLQYLLEVVGLSTTVRGDWIRKQLEVADRIDVPNPDSPVKFIRDESFRYRMTANPYRCDTLLEFAEQEVARRQSKIEKLQTDLAAVTALQQSLKNTLPRAPEATDEELDSYFGGRFEHQMMRACTPVSAIDLGADDGPPDRENFNNELDYRRATKRLSTLNEEYADCTKKLGEAVSIVTYLKNRPV